MSIWTSMTMKAPPANAAPTTTLISFVTPACPNAQIAVVTSVADVILFLNVLTATPNTAKAAWAKHTVSSVMSVTIVRSVCHHMKMGVYLNVARKTVKKIIRNNLLNKNYLFFKLYSYELLMTYMTVWVYGISN